MFQEEFNGIVRIFLRQTLCDGDAEISLSFFPPSFISRIIISTEITLHPFLLPPKRRRQFKRERKKVVMENEIHPWIMHQRFLKLGWKNYYYSKNCRQ